MNLVLISTSNLDCERIGVLKRMLRSVEHAAVARPEIPVSVLLLLQKCPEYLYWSISGDLPRFVQTIPTVDTLPLSAARNVLLEQALLSGLIGAETIVGFPDDDCWYPDDTLDYVTRLFARRPHLDLWFCRYASNPIHMSELAMKSHPAATRDVIRQASSNTIFVRGRVLSTRAFDETLGIGTANGGGEDTEFALRVHLMSRESLYLPAPVIGHRDKTAQLRPKYYRGALIVLARYARREPRIVFELARKLAVGLWLVGTRQLPIAAFVRAVIAAVRSDRPTVARVSANG